MAHEVIAFGEALWDLLPDGEKLGGAPLNFAYRMASLGRRTALVTALGTDALGDRAAAILTDLGIDTQYVRRDPEHATGTVPVTLAESGSPQYVILPDVAYDYIEPSEALLADASAAKCICFGSLVQRDAVSRSTLHEMLAAAPDSFKVYDINLRRDCYSREIIETSLGSASMLKLNDDEVETVSELFDFPVSTIPDFCRQVLERWPLSLVVVTLGAKGALAVSREAAAYSPGRKVTVADTIGAGDAFTAGFVHKYLDGADLQTCCAYGNALGALVAGTNGGTEYIAPSQIEAFLANDRDLTVDPEIAAVLG